MTRSLELLDRIDHAWVEFRRAVDQVPDLSVRTASGWTALAMLAHVTAWHDATTYRLHRFAATGVPQDKVEPDDDAFNARVARESIGLPAAKVVAALDGSIVRLRAAVSDLPSGYAGNHEGWVEAVVAGNTFEHYEEHLPELTASA